MVIAKKYQSPISLDQLLLIERKAYPPQMWEMQWAKNWEDIADYAEVSLKRLVILSDSVGWYAIVALHRLHRAEFVDLAKIPGAPTIDWIYLVTSLRELGVKKIFGDMRNDTSYRRFTSQIDCLGAFGVRMIKNTPYERSGEVFHDFVIKI